VTPPRQKDWLDLVVDFFFGAAFVDFWIGLGFLRASGYHLNIHWEWRTLYLSLLSATLIAGSLAALFRNHFWGSYDTYSVIPPMEESVSRKSKLILWILFALGCVSLAMLFAP